MIRRLYVEKKPGFDVEARHILEDLRRGLGMEGLQALRLINRYDVDGLDDAAYRAARDSVFSEPNVDTVYEEDIDLRGWRFFAVEYLPGQYDQRADSAEQCVRLLVPDSSPVVRTARLIALYGDVSDADLENARAYFINPIESRAASMDMPHTLDMPASLPADVAMLDGFSKLDERQLRRFIDEYGLAMDVANLEYCRQYFAGEGREPTITELRILDTYWSDHCRHTTFLTELCRLDIEKGEYSTAIEHALQLYIDIRHKLGRQDKPVTLMDMATIGARLIKSQGGLEDLDESEEINACSIKIKVDVDGQQKDWLLQFKNETHNHPSEIEPFGGAATCLGGAIRDILSGRAYAHQSMRISGSGDPSTPYADTLPGKLPQRKITTGAAAGFSSYGNQIGLCTGYVNEIYDEGYVAKRMELGAVVGACPAENVARRQPEPGDAVILLGGRTGRDGIGGATGSSKEHDITSLNECGSEVQKGNALTERKIQRLFRDPQLARMIKRCNDFGAGGVSVAIGELADGLDIDLDKVPRKYDGLDGTELAISESQERMAVVVDAADVDSFIALAAGENLEATVVAEVTDSRRLRLSWRGNVIADLSRDFLDTNGLTGQADARVSAVNGSCYLDELPSCLEGMELEKAWVTNLRRMNVCSQTGLVQRFDSNIGAGSVMMPCGGMRQLTPEEGMVAKIPVLEGETDTVSAMAYGYLPGLARWSPFHAGMYAVAESLSRMAAMGIDALSCRLSMQEYFEKMTGAEKWGKPAAALLGALHAQCEMGVPAIGGKDSMSGTFESIHVPPTIISFAVNTGSAEQVVSAAIAKSELEIYLCRLPYDEGTRAPIWSAYRDMLDDIHRLAKDGRLHAASVLREGGLAAALTRMCVGNDKGLDITARLDDTGLFAPDCGSIVLCLEGKAPESMEKYIYLGRTTDDGIISIGEVRMDINMLRGEWMSTLESIFPTKADTQPKAMPDAKPWNKRGIAHAKHSFAKPRVLIPVFPGTNSEYDSARAFERAGATAEILVINNLDKQGIEDSIQRFATALDNSQILMLPGGFSSGDEPDGSGKFIATFLRNPRVAQSVNGLYKQRDGLILGICNGFQALIKTGLLPYGELGELSKDAPTLTFNSLGRHVARMAYTRIQSVLSPWTMLNQPGEVFAVPVSHGEGRFTASAADLDKLFANGQVATQYSDGVDVALLEPYNPNGSDCAIEGICSPDGRILGKMGHNERAGALVPKNIPGNTDQKLFESGVRYFA